MHSEKIKIAVRFYREGSDILAVFPKTYTAKKTRICYGHVGQHSETAQEYYRKLKPAIKEEYKDLASELEGQGYELVILNKH